MTVFPTRSDRKGPIFLKLIFRKPMILHPIIIKHPFFCDSVTYSIEYENETIVCSFPLRSPYLKTKFFI